MSTGNSDAIVVNDAMSRINNAWLSGRIDDLASMVHADIVTVLPAFAGRVHGKPECIGGFRDFCENAKIHEFHEHERRADIAGSTAAVTFRYEMVYERSSKRYRCTGRDLWIFQQESGVGCGLAGDAGRG